MKFKYLVQTRLGNRWTTQSTWQMEPRMLGKFIGEIPTMLGLRASDIRVCRACSNTLTDFDFTPEGKAAPSA